MNKITCDVAKDIMPLCADNICSTNSKNLLEKHIEECLSCKKIWNSYNNSSITNTLTKENTKNFKKLVSQIKKKNKLKTFFIILTSFAISIILILFLSLNIFGLFFLGQDNYTTMDIKNYGIHEGHIKGERELLQSDLYVFPKEISPNSKNIEFLYSCGSMGFGEHFQQYLKCTYSIEKYQSEINRLKKIKCEIKTKKGTIINKIEFSNKKFDFPAYIAAYGGVQMYEYALCNEETKTITYILLQGISNKQVSFSKNYLPKEYQSSRELLGDESLNNKNIYYHKAGSIWHHFKD
ncbi:MAG: hypothetical protein ABF289_04800 [Clostridiales bacterium]